MEKNETSETLLHQLLLVSQNKTGVEAIREKLADHFNELILEDFNQLVQLLYRMDVDEKKLKNVLQSNPGNDAGEMIADLVIERQLQKIKSRQESRKNNHEINEDEKW